MRLEKKDIPFTMVANVVLKDADLSLKAKGLYAYLFSKPTGWQFSAARMVKECKESRPTLLAILKELEDRCLLQRKKQQSGRVDYILTHAVCPIPQSKESLPSAESKNATVQDLHRAEVLPVSNTDKSINTDSENKKEGTHPFFDEAKSKAQPYREFVLELAKHDYLKPEKIHTIMLEEFIPYWSEKSANGKKFRWQMERTFDARLRFTRWLKIYHEKKHDFRCKANLWHQADSRCYCFKKTEEPEQPGKPVPAHITEQMRNLAAGKRISRV